MTACAYLPLPSLGAGHKLDLRERKKNQIFSDNLKEHFRNICTGCEMCAVLKCISAGSSYSCQYVRYFKIQVDVTSTYIQKRCFPALSLVPIILLLSIKIQNKCQKPLVIRALILPDVLHERTPPQSAHMLMDRPKATNDVTQL